MNLLAAAGQRGRCQDGLFARAGRRAGRSSSRNHPAGAGGARVTAPHGTGARRAHGLWARCERFAPSAGPAVMATGILAVGLHLDGYRVPSLIALAVTGGSWLPLAASFTADLVHGGHRWARPGQAPAALTAVAATTVLGTRISMLGWHPLAWVLLALAAAAWPAPVIEELRRGKHRLPGASFLACVATQGLAVLAATLAAGDTGPWPAIAAVILLCCGIALFLDVLFRFDPRQIRLGGGDQWVAAGAAAISALAASVLATCPQLPDAARHILRPVTLTMLVLDLAGYAVLLTAEAEWPRPHLDVRRWATVFPLGMSAAAALSAGTALGIGALHALGTLLLWVAAAAWLTLLTDLAVHHARKIQAARRPPTRTRRG